MKDGEKLKEDPNITLDEKQVSNMERALRHVKNLDEKRKIVIILPIIIQMAKSKYQLEKVKCPNKVFHNILTHKVLKEVEDVSKKNVEVKSTT